MELLTDIGSALGNGEIGAGTPSPALVAPLTAATVGPCSVVLTLTSQLVLIKHAAVGVKVALASVKGRETSKELKMYVIYK